MTTSVRALTAMIILTMGIGPALARAATGTDSDSLRFRATFGLTQDPKVLSDDAFTATSVEKYGVPLTTDEEKDIDERFALRDQLDSLVAFVQGHADVLGGVWLDQTASLGHGTIVTVGITNQADDESLSQLASLVPDGTDVALAHVTYSLSQLLAASDSAIAMGVKHPEYGVLGARVETQNNRVVVRIGPESQGIPDIETGPIVFEVGERLRSVACNPAARCTFLPYRGGLQIIDKIGGTWYQCTPGFWAKQAGTTNFYMITSAHCDQAPYGDDAYRDANVATHLGLWNRDSIDGSGCSTTCKTETYRVLVDPARVPATGRNCVYESAGLTCRQITSSAIWANIVNGTPVCMAAVVSSVVCGTVTSTGSDQVFSAHHGNQWITFTKGINTNWPAVSGDSGSPLYAGSTAYGIVSAVAGGRTFSTSVQWALSDLGLSLCTTSTCPQ